MWLILETKTDLFILLCRERKELLMWQLKNNVIVMTKLCLKDNWKHKFFLKRVKTSTEEVYLYRSKSDVCSVCL